MGALVRANGLQAGRLLPDNLYPRTNGRCLPRGVLRHGVCGASELGLANQTC